MQRKNQLRVIALAVSLSLAPALPALAQSGNPQSSTPGSTPPAQGTTMQPSERAAQGMVDKATTPADQALNQRIRQVLNADMILVTVVQKIQLDTDNGEVILLGSVATDKQKADIAAKVQQVAGVKKIDNQLRTAAN